MARGTRVFITRPVSAIGAALTWSDLLSTPHPNVYTNMYRTSRCRHRLRYMRRCARINRMKLPRRGDAVRRWCKHLGSTCVSLPPAPELTSTSDHTVPLNWHLQILQATAGICFPPPAPLPPTAVRSTSWPCRRSPGAGVSVIIGNIPQPFTSIGGIDAPASVSKFAAAAIALAGDLPFRALCS